MMRIAAQVLCLILLMGRFATSAASPSDVDSTFGTDGKTVTPAQQTLLQPGEPAVDSQGRIYVPIYGRSSDSSVPVGPLPNQTNQSYAAVMRLTASGMLDSNFGNGGLVLLPEAPVFAPMAIAVDEKRQQLLIGGAADVFGLGAPTSAAVMRIDFNGVLDTTFGNGGLASPAVSSLISDVDAIDLLDDGRILTASTDGDSMSVSRLLANGSVDQAFGTDGRTSLIASSGQPAVSVLRRDRDDNIFVCGPRGFRTMLSGVEFPDDGVRVGRLSADGMPVGAFGDGGSKEVDLDGPAVCVDLQPGESGGFSVAAATQSMLIVARLRADGSRDPAFNGTGLDAGALQTATAPVGRALDDGRLLLARSGGAIDVGGAEIALYSPPGHGGIEISRFTGSPELRRTSGATSASDSGGGGGVFGLGALLILSLFVVLGSVVARIE
jgi:uncharacterized delta-60 repeat protein